MMDDKEIQNAAIASVAVLDIMKTALADLEKEHALQTTALTALEPVSKLEVRNHEDLRETPNAAQGTIEILKTSIAALAMRIDLHKTAITAVEPLARMPEPRAPDFKPTKAQGLSLIKDAVDKLAPRKAT